MKGKEHRNIFIVGREEDFNQLLDYIFTKPFRYRFFDFRSGEECLKRLDTRPDLVIIDYSLPGMNGYDTMMRIKDECPDCDVVVVVEPEYRKLPAELLKAGASDYIIRSETLVADIVLKAELFLKKEKPAEEKLSPQLEAQVAGMHPVMKVVGYTLLFLILVSAGLYYYH